MLTTHADRPGHDDLLPETRRYAEASLDCFKRNWRFLRFLDTRQKWMLMHLVTLTCSQEREGRAQGAAANRICEAASSLGIASRNTSLAFFGQLAAYGYIHKRDDCDDRRVKLLSLSDSAEAALMDWTRGLIETATGQDAGGIDMATLKCIHLEIVERLFADAKWVKAPLDIRLTQDTRGGWLIMSALLRHMQDDAPGGAWVAAPGLRVPDVAKSFGLSRSTLYRLVRVSVEAGIMAWEEPQTGVLMVNEYHLRQYSRWVGRLLQATSAACDAVLGSPSFGDGVIGGLDEDGFGCAATAMAVERRLAIGA
ncbi:MAG: hypothetical protein EON94_13920 [Caulobacteraceae bacterium]|nr:MAG: hypothetical protein EON94_13920 [Caulobacteraceae bacterium]